jgi:YbgC/YbaW family acyl-CoA thioester hydrolase
MITNLLQVTVRWGDADPAGIAFYPRFYEWYDMATEALFASAGLPFPDTFERYRIVGVPIVESGSTFLSPARWADVLTIRSRIAWVKDKTFRVEHEITIGERLCARGFEVRAWVLRPEAPGGPLRAAAIAPAVRARLGAGPAC